MACEEYSGWMSVAALGALPAGREGELRAHVGRCEACRSKWEAASALVAAIDGAVTTLVAGEPSPQFASRLRARIADEPTPAAWLLPARPRLAAALVAAVALFAVLLLRSPERASRGMPATNTASAVAPSRAASAGPATQRVDAPSPQAPRHAASDRRGRARFVEPEVLVPRGQLSAALLLANAVSNGRIDGTQISVSAAAAGNPIEVKPIEIAPLALPALDVTADAEPLEHPGRQ
jgi:hypothetical protein